MSNYPSYLEYIPNWLMKKGMITNEDEFIKRYKERKAQKAQIKAELQPIDWYPQSLP